MNKIWRIVSAAALLCLVIGIAGIGIGFFTGSSPVILQTHGNLAGYMERLTINREILMQHLSPILAYFGL